PGPAPRHGAGPQRPLPRELNPPPQTDPVLSSRVHRASAIVASLRTREFRTGSSGTREFRTGSSACDTIAGAKARIGYGLGTRTPLHDVRFGHVADELERHRFDSLWLSERIGGDAPDPLVAMAYGAGRTEHLKFGMSVMVLPGRNPMVLAKSLATLATLSDGRLLPAFGLGLVHPLEQQAFGVERTERAAWFDESMTVLRQCWTGAP